MKKTSQWKWLSAWKTSGKNRRAMARRRVAKDQAAWRLICGGGARRRSAAGRRRRGEEMKAGWRKHILVWRLGGCRNLLKRNRKPERLKKVVWRKQGEENLYESEENETVMLNENEKWKWKKMKGAKKKENILSARRETKRKCKAREAQCEKKGSIFRRETLQTQINGWNWLSYYWKSQWREADGCGEAAEKAAGNAVIKLPTVWLWRREPMQFLPEAVKRLSEEKYSVILISSNWLSITEKPTSMSRYTIKINEIQYLWWLRGIEAWRHCCLLMKYLEAEKSNDWNKWYNVKA